MNDGSTVSSYWAPNRRWKYKEMADLFEIVIDGSTLKDAGEKHGVSAERARQIVRRVIRTLVHGSMITEPMPDDCHWSTLADVRQNSAFWKRQVENLRARHDKPCRA